MGSLEERVETMRTVELSDEDISLLFFCLGTGFVSELVSIDAVNRIGQRLSPDFTPYTKDEGAIRIDDAERTT